MSTESSYDKSRFDLDPFPATLTYKPNLAMSMLILMQKVKVKRFSSENAH